jgi:hypothetical protein
MGQPKRLESYDPAYQEMFTRVGEGQEVFTLECESHGKAVYLCQRLRSYRKLLIEQSQKDKSLISAASQARMVEVAVEGPRVLVRPTGGTWTSQIVMQALMKGKIPQSKVMPLSPPISPPPLEEEDPPLPKGHGYY